LENSEVNQKSYSFCTVFKNPDSRSSERWARSDKDKAELFAAHLSEVFTPNDSHPDQEMKDDINTLPKNIQIKKLFSPKEFEDKIGFLNIYKKTPGIDKNHT
jgi:hypothetical protein